MLDSNVGIIDPRPKARSLIVTELDNFTDLGVV
jgi:hypothetical protein